MFGLELVVSMRLIVLSHSYSNWWTQNNFSCSANFPITCKAGSWKCPNSTCVISWHCLFSPYLSAFFHSSKFTLLCLQFKTGHLLNFNFFNSAFIAISVHTRMLDRFRDTLWTTDTKLKLGFGTFFTTGCFYQFFCKWIQHEMELFFFQQLREFTITG